MKKLVLLLVILTAITSAFAGEATDTTFTNDLNNDGTTDKIHIKINEEEGTFALSVNSSKFVYMPESTSDMTASVVRINYGKYLMVTSMAYYGYQAVLFTFGDKLDSIASFWSLNIPVVDERGIIKVNNWLGFWSANYEYHMRENKLVPVYKTEYTIPESIKENKITTTGSLFLRSDKNENSKAAIEVKTGTEVFILKADIRNKCKSPDEWEEACNWYYFKSRDGKEGWIMLKDFQDKVEGIPWAG